MLVTAHRRQLNGNDSNYTDVYSIIKNVAFEVIGSAGREGREEMEGREEREGMVDILVLLEATIGFNAGLILSSIAFRLLSAAKCLLTCLVKWSLLINLRSHMLHTNFFSPVCVLLCRDNSSERENCRPHASHIQMNGFSPAITNRENDESIEDFPLMTGAQTCMSPNVSLQVRALVIGFSAVVVMALIATSSFESTRSAGIGDVERRQR